MNSEIRSVLNCLHNILRCLFFGLPKPGGRDDLRSGPGPLILPTLLPKIYASLQGNISIVHYNPWFFNFSSLFHFIKENRISLQSKCFSASVSNRHVPCSVLAATISRLRKLPLLLLPGEKLDIIVRIFDQKFKCRRIWCPRATSYFRIYLDTWCYSKPSHFELLR